MLSLTQNFLSMSKQVHGLSSTSRVYETLLKTYASLHVARGRNTTCLETLLQ